MRIALAQINTSMGAIEINCARIASAYDEAARAGAQLVVFPEMAVNGYPPRDLLEQPAFVRQGVEALHGLAARMTGPAAIVGFVRPNADAGKPLFNSAALIDGGRVVSIHDKTLLPTYDVFDEARHFEPAAEVRLAHWRGLKLAITICEDFWSTALYRPHPLYHDRSRVGAAGAGPEVQHQRFAFSVGKRKLTARITRTPWRKWKRSAGGGHPVGATTTYHRRLSNVGAQGGVLETGGGFREDVVWDWGADGGGACRRPGEEIRKHLRCVKSALTTTSPSAVSGVCWSAGRAHRFGADGGAGGRRARPENVSAC